MGNAFLLPIALAAALFAFAEPQVASAVTLIHSNDVLGEIEPCGCRSNPLGGMVRKDLYLKTLPPGEATLQLDAGDLLFPTSPMAPLLAEQSEVQARFLLESLQMTGLDAVVPGEKEFALGIKPFLKLIAKTKIKFLAANLVNKKSGSPLLPRDAVFTKKDQGKKGKLRVGVFGLVGADFDWPRGLKVLSPLETARKEVANLHKKADLVIALTHENLEQDRELAEKVPGIDLIVGGHTQAFLQKPLVVGKTIILESSFRNQYLGVMPLPPQLEAYQMVALDSAFDPPAGQTTPMVELVSRFKKAIADLNSQSPAKDASQAEPARSTAQIQTFPRCAECHLKQFDFWRRTAHAMALHPLIEKDQFKNKECLSCHTVGLGDPQGLTDVNALATLKAMPSPGPSEPSPVSAQTLDAYLKAVHEAGSINDKVPPPTSPPGEAQPIRGTLSMLEHSWTPVQCENCHQRGGDHPFGSSPQYTKTVEKNVCLNCHTAERAPGWYSQDGKPNWETIEAKRKLITCPAGNFSPEEMPETP